MHHLTDKHNLLTSSSKKYAYQCFKVLCQQINNRNLYSIFNVDKKNVWLNYVPWSYAGFRLEFVVAGLCNGCTFR